MTAREKAAVEQMDRELHYLRQRCIALGRDPIGAEIRYANRLLREIDRIEGNTTMNQPLTRETGPIEIRETRKNPFRSFGEFAQSVMRAGTPGGEVDPRLYEARAATGLSEGTPSEGGFLVHNDWSDELLKGVFETGKLAALCNRIQISGRSNSIKLPAIDETSRAAGSRWGGIRGYWLEEAGEKTASKPKFRELTLNLHKLIGLCYATDELLDDAAVLETVLRQGFQDEFGFMMDDAILNGTGAGQPLGILNSGCVVQVAKETGQAAATVVYENIVKMWQRLLPRSRGNAVWLVNQDVEQQLYSMSMTVGTGGVPVYMPAGGASASPYSTLFGRPVIPCEQCQTLGTAGDILLCDFRNGYILAEKGGMASDMSIHVRFVYDESVFRFVMRVDGQPVLDSAVTPYKGSNTLSHFVKLATRS